MATGANQEILELVYRLKGEEDILRARRAVERNQEAVERLARAYLAGKVSEQDFERESVQLAASLRRAEAQLERLPAATDRVQNSFARFSPAAKGAGGAIFELSRGFQDFSAAGLYGISNNVEGLARAFTELRGAGLAAIRSALLGPAGIVAGFTGLALFGPQAFRAVKSFADSLYESGPSLDATIDRLRKIGEEADKAAQKAESAGKRVATAFLPPAEVEAGRRFGELLAKSDWTTARRAMAESGRAAQIASDPAIRAADKDIADTEAALTTARDNLQRMRASQEEVDPRRRTPLWQVQQTEQRVRRLEQFLAGVQRQRESRRAGLIAEGETWIEQQAAAAAAGDPLARQTIIGNMRSIGRGGLAADLAAITPELIESQRRNAAQARDAIENTRRRAGWGLRAAGDWLSQVNPFRAPTQEQKQQQEQAEQQRKQQERAGQQANEAVARQAREDAQRFGGGFDERIGAAILANEAQQRAGRGVSDEQADRQLTDQLADTMVRNSGGELTPDRALAAAHEIVSGARQGYEQQLTTLLNQQVSERDALLQMGNSALGALQQLGDNFQVNSQSYRQLAVQFQSLQQALWAAQRQRPLPSPRVPRN